MNEIQISTQFLFYNTENGKISVRVIIDSENETIWTTQKGMSEIFGVETQTISYHLKKIFEYEELSENQVVQINFEKVDNKAFRKAAYYNLDAIIAVGYRVNSIQATRFRIWATQVLKEYLIKGFVLDDERLKQGNKVFGNDHFKELIERIREIRASERLFYEKITDLYRDCSEDYDAKSPITINFYKEVQNKFHYAIHQHTAAEIIKLRANSEKPFMGLTSYKNSKNGGKVLKSDVGTAKNYLTENEIKGLNRLVNMFLDYAENLAEKRVVSTMADWVKRLDAFLIFYEYPLLTKLGKVSHDVAKRFAETEYAKFRIKQDKEYKSDFNKFVEDTAAGNIPIETMKKSKTKKRK
jgi:hypothetical protein